MIHMIFVVLLRLWSSWSSWSSGNDQGPPHGAGGLHRAAHLERVLHAQVPERQGNIAGDMRSYVGLSESQKLRDLYNEAAERHTHLLEQVPQSKPFIIYHQKWSAMVTDVIICHQILSHSANLRIPLLIWSSDKQVRRPLHLHLPQDNPQVAFFVSDRNCIVHKNVQNCLNCSEKCSGTSSTWWSAIATSSIKMIDRWKKSSRKKTKGVLLKSCLM